MKKADSFLSHCIWGCLTVRRSRKGCSKARKSYLVAFASLCGGVDTTIRQSLIRWRFSAGLFRQAPTYAPPQKAGHIIPFLYFSQSRLSCKVRIISFKTMAEVLGVVASIIAVVQISGTVISICDNYRSALKNTSRDIDRLKVLSISRKSWKSWQHYSVERTFPRFILMLSTMCCHLTKFCLIEKQNWKI
jgi:hypothetical protein